MSMKQCLIVDDSRIIRQVARHILEDLEFVAEESQDGIGAIEACRNHLPDLVLLDANLPNVDMPALLRRLRTLSANGRPYVLICTTENDPEMIAAAMEAGADEYILKPFDRTLMEDKLRDAGLMSDSS